MKETYILRYLLSITILLLAFSILFIACERDLGLVQTTIVENSKESYQEILDDFVDYTLLARQTQAMLSSEVNRLKLKNAIVAIGEDHAGNLVIIIDQDHKDFLALKSAYTRTRPEPMPVIEQPPAPAETREETVEQRPATAETETTAAPEVEIRTVVKVVIKEVEVPARDAEWYHNRRHLHENLNKDSLNDANGGQSFPVGHTHSFGEAGHDHVNIGDDPDNPVVKVGPAYDWEGE